MTLFIIREFSRPADSCMQMREPAGEGRVPHFPLSHTHTHTHTSFSNNLRGESQVILLVTTEGFDRPQWIDQPRLDPCAR